MKKQNTKLTGSSIWRRTWSWSRWKRRTSFHNELNAVPNVSTEALSAVDKGSITSSFTWRRRPYSLWPSKRSSLPTVSPSSLVEPAGVLGAGAGGLLLLKINMEVKNRSSSLMSLTKRGSETKNQNQIAPQERGRWEEGTWKKPPGWPALARTRTDNHDEVSLLGNQDQRSTSVVVWTGPAFLTIDTFTKVNQKPYTYRNNIKPTISEH